MKVNDAIAGALLLAFAAAIGLYASTLPTIPGQRYGAAAFPMLVAVGLGGCSLLLIRKGARAWNAGPRVEWADWTSSPRSLINLAVTLALLLGYVFFSDRIGFIPIAIAVLFVQCLSLRVRWWLAAFVAVLATLLIHAAFYKLLRVPLPWGVLTPIAW
jgi:putative tricarboxylic transport membrane protein